MLGSVLAANETALVREKIQPVRHDKTLRVQLASPMLSTFVSG
jgi:hypothetical protein